MLLRITYEAIPKTPLRAYSETQNLIYESRIRDSKSNILLWKVMESDPENPYGLE